MLARWSSLSRHRRVHRKPVMSRLATQWISFRAEVLKHRAQLSLSVRVTTAAVSSFILSHVLHLPVPLWAVLTAVILTQVSFGRSLKATIDYMIGTVGGAIYTGVLATLVPHTNEIALAGVLVLAVGPLALLGAVNSRFNVATFTGVMVLLLPGIVHGSPIESAFYRVVEVAVGSITALAVSLLILPARAHSLAIEAAAQMLDLAARSIPELFMGFAQTCDASVMGSIQDRIGQAIARLQMIATEANHERISFLEAEPELAPLLRTLLRLRHDLVLVGRAAAEPLPETIRQRLGPPLARAAESAADYLRQSGEALAARRAGSPLAAAEATLDGCADAFAAIRRERVTLGLPVDTVERIFALGFALEQLRHNFRDLERCVREAARRK
jgi:uncharacterized membrane protein YccC